MVEFPLLPLPTPEVSRRPRSYGRPPQTVFPGRKRQVQRIGPIFQRLQKVLNRDPLDIRLDPAGIAPERALVFEIAGSIDSFHKAISRVDGLEFFHEEEGSYSPDEDFHILDTRVGHKGEIRDDKLVVSRLYMAMPDIRALKELVSLWNLYEKGQPLGQGFSLWQKAFEQLIYLRPWGPQDRIPDESITYLNSQLDSIIGPSLRLEVELWSYQSTNRQQSAFERVKKAVKLSGGHIIRRASIPEIAYEAALIDIPGSGVRSLVRREDIALVICDDVMLIRPQSDVSFPIEINTPVTDIQSVEPLLLEDDKPIVGLFDSVPVQGHQLLEGRIELDDPDDLNELSEVSGRYHGTEMASLILHGDLNIGESSLRRPIYLRPVLYAPGSGACEQTLPDHLLVDTIYRAVLRMKVGSEGDEATAPDVFIVNLSLGIKNRPFTGLISPLGRLLDYLATRFNILFIVSAGNIGDPLPVPALRGNEDIDSSEFRQLAILEALDEQKSQRTLLSPAEAINVITVGAWYADSVETDWPSRDYEPYLEKGPNISSGQGLGYRMVIKPDIFMPGGRERFRTVRRDQQGILHIEPAPLGRIYGVKVAIPDPNGLLDKDGLTSGTSVAAALTTRSAHRLFDVLINNDKAPLTNIDPMFYAVVIKALLAHRARWNEETSRLLNDINKSKGVSYYGERLDNITRLLGYGHPAIEEVMECATNRATLVGCSKITADDISHQFRVPLPSSLERIQEPRSVTLTLAWFSPVNVRSQMYRKAKLEIKPGDFKKRVGVERLSLQPSNISVLRGSLFHTHYTGKKAVDFIDDGNLTFQVFCRAQGGPLDQSIKYGLVVTIEAGEHIPVYQEIRNRLVVQPRI